MTFRTFTLKDVFDRDQAESQMRIAALCPLTTADLAAGGMRRIEPYFPLSHGIPRVDDRRIVWGIIYVIRGGLM